ncbi:MAG TPA: GxxExxY protein [Acetobacteraceae bacterium]|jgi:GxxExxY protein|nr:GxxExxY protein [Acetobacteraceae bacterium]
MLLAEELTERVIGQAIEVHRHTGPGMLGSVYATCSCRQPWGAGMAYERRVSVPVMYKEEAVGDGFRADIVVAREVIVQIKAVAAALPAHEAQPYTYLRMSGIHVRLLFNFNAPRLIDGLRRILAWSRTVRPLWLLWPSVSPFGVRAKIS